MSTPNPLITRFEALLAKGQDNAMLRYSLGHAYLQQDQAAQAVAHLQQALAQDPHYSAAWNQLGRAQLALGQPADAVATFDQGLAVAQAKGDMQVVREMEVFRRRAAKALQTDDDR